MEGFTKLSEVNLVEDVNESTSVLVEENSEIKRVPKSKIGAQADWNEEDETKPSFILNKPSKLGGTVLYFRPYGISYLYNKDEEGNLPTTFSEDNAVTMDEFLNSFLTGGCIINELDSNNDIISVYRQVVYFTPYDSNKKANVGLAHASGISLSQFDFRTT